MRTSLRLRQSRMLALFCAGLLVWLPTVAQAQVLDQVPSESALVLRVKNMQELSTKAAVLAKKWGLDQMVPQTADPLGAWLDMMKFSAGLDKGGDAGFVIANFDFDAQVPPMLILVPVTDYKAFIGNFADAKQDGDLDVVHMVINGKAENDDTYVAHWGKYAALTPSKAMLAKKPDGFKPVGVTAKELANKDLVYCLNFKTLGPKLLDQVKQNREKILTELEKSLTGNPQFNQKFVPAVKAVVVQGLAIAQEFLTDVQAVTFSVNLSEDGIATSLVTEFAGETYLGNAFSSLKNTDGPLMTGLPDGKYLMYGGSVTGGDVGFKMMNDVLAPIVKELKNAGEDSKPIVDYIESLTGMMKATKGMAFGLMAPSGMLGATPLLQIVGIYSGNANELLAAQQKAMESEQQLMGLFQKIGAEVPKTEIKFTPNAREVDGVKFNQFSSTLAIDDNAPQAAQMKQMMAMFYGPGGMTGYAGAVDDQHMLLFSGVEDATVSAAIKAVKANQDTISSNAALAIVNKNLPQSRLGVYYLPIDTVFSTVANYAKMMGLPMPVNMKPNLPPLGLAVATEGSALRVDGFIPADLVQEIMATAIKYQMLQQGGKPGQPGGL